MTDQAPTVTPERLAWLLDDAGFTTVAETILELKRTLHHVRRGASGRPQCVDCRLQAIERLLGGALTYADGFVDPVSGTCSYAIQSARDAGWPEAEDLITRQVECLTHLRATCDSSLEPGLLLRTLAIYIDETGMGS